MNRVPSKVLEGGTPYQVMHNSLPNLSLLKVFGSLCYFSTLSNHIGKLDDRARKCAFLGYKTGMKGYVGYDLHSREILVSRNAVFYEHIFPCTSQHNKATGATWQYMTPNSETQPSIPNPVPTADMPVTQPTNADMSVAQTTDTEVTESTECPASTSETTEHEPSVPANIPMHGTNSETLADTVPESTTENVILEPETNNEPAPRRSTRSRKAPSYPQGYHCSHLKTHTEPSKCIYPLSSYVSYESLSTQHKSYAVSLSTITEPTTYSQAVRDKCWVEAMNAELKALEMNHTWQIVE